MAVDEKTSELLERLEKSIHDTLNGENYRNFLKVQSQFHNYSFNNAMLIYSQRPDATRVASYEAWNKKFGRHILKGEKGIQILAPAAFRDVRMVDKVDPGTGAKIIDPITGKPAQVKEQFGAYAFKTVHVFDLKQTDGKELPEICKELQGSSINSKSVIDALKSISKVPIFEKDIDSGAKGYYSRTENIIAIKKGMSLDQTVKTLIHETAHSLLHNKPESALLDRATKEVQAESVAFIVSEHFGINTSEYSFEYLANWSSGKELKELKASFNIIQKQASELIDKIDVHFQELLREQPILSMPDNSLSVKDMEQYGYEFVESNEMLPLGKDKAIELFDKHDAIYLIYPDNSEGIPETKEQIVYHFEKGGLGGIERKDWEAILDYEIVKDQTETSLSNAMDELSEKPFELTDIKEIRSIVNVQIGEDFYNGYIDEGQKTLLTENVEAISNSLLNYYKENPTLTLDKELNYISEMFKETLERGEFVSAGTIPTSDIAMKKMGITSPTNLENEIAPGLYPIVVEVVWSESDKLEKGQLLSVEDADKLFSTLESTQRELRKANPIVDYTKVSAGEHIDHEPYLKTKLCVHLKDGITFSERFDIGDNPYLTVTEHFLNATGVNLTQYAKNPDLNNVLLKYDAKLHDLINTAAADQFGLMAKAIESYKLFAPFNDRFVAIYDRAIEAYNAVGYGKTNPGKDAFQQLKNLEGEILKDIRSHIVKMYEGEFKAASYLPDKAVMKLYDMNCDSPTPIPLKDIKKMYKDAGIKCELDPSQDNMETFESFKDLNNGLTKANRDLQKDIRKEAKLNNPLTKTPEMELA